MPEDTTNATSSVVVQLTGNAANVLLMDRANFQSYRRGARDGDVMLVATS